MSDGGWDQARSMFPSWKYEDSEWSVLFDEDPDKLTDLLGTLYRVARTSRERREGTFTGQRGGRRPATVDGNLDDLWKMISPQYSMEPFPVAMVELMNGSPIRPFAARAEMDHRHLSRLIRGKQPLTMALLERLALTGGVAPFFFVEWRAMKVCGVIAAALVDKPHLSVQALKQLESMGVR